jgi:uncharacterized protein involved in exopolysaccharide biosynthesis
VPGYNRAMRAAWDKLTFVLGAAIILFFFAGVGAGMLILLGDLLS